MIILPEADKAIIPIEKLTRYALNFDKQPYKALAFELALGYNINNAELLIKNVKDNLSKYPAKFKGSKGYGNLYEVTMNLVGENGKTAKVLTGWIDDVDKKEVRLTSIYVDK